MAFFSLTKSNKYLASLPALVLSLSAASSFAGDETSAQSVEPAVTYSAVMTVDTLSNVSGGLRKGAWTQGNLDLTAAWQGPSGFEAFGYVLVDQHGGFGARYAGDVQGVSNIDAPAGVRLFEAWTRYTSTDQKWVTTAGIINLNGLFDTQPTGGVFLNSSHGIGPDYSQNGPSIFPFSGLGLVQEWRPMDSLRFRMGVFDAVPGDPDHASVFTSLHLSKEDGANVVIEGEKNFERGFIKVGHWQYTAKSDRLDGTGTGIRQGVYAQIAATLTQEKEDSDQGLGTWARFGRTSGALSPLSGYAGGGLTYTGPFTGRDHDVVGMSIASVTFGSDYRDLNSDVTNAETTLELTYQAEIKPGLVLQPDLQFVHHPSGSSVIADACVVGLRLRMDFTH